jgi:hypothetical protein
VVTVLHTGFADLVMHNRMAGMEIKTEKIARL